MAKEAAEYSVNMAILALLIDQRERAAGDTPLEPKTELLLADLDFPAPVIAQLMHKNVDAVRKTIQRGRKGS